MKTQLSSLDLSLLIHELQSLVGSRIQKVYQIEKRTVKVDLHTKNGTKELIAAPHFLCITKFKREAPKTPSSFSMLLRKHLVGGVVESIEQHDFERIVEVEIARRENKYKLIFEIFSKGNVILTDNQGEIIGLLDWQRWKDRILGVGKPYAYPPPAVDVKRLDFKEFFDILKKSGKSLVKSLATNLGLGGTYAEEICMRAGVDKGTSDLTETVAKKVYKEMSNLLESKICARIVFEGSERLDAAPTKLLLYRDRKEKEFETFNDAVDNYFFQLDVEAVKEKSEEEFSKELERLERLKKNQEGAITKLEEDTGEYKKAGDLIYVSFDEISKLLDDVEEGKGHWTEPLKSAGYAQINAKEKSFLFKGIWISVDKSVPENAEFYYSKSKKAKQKLTGAKEALKKTLKEIDGAEKKKEKGMTSLKERFEKKVEKKKKWYDAFRWFISSDGFLVVGGRDAATNEILIKKHTEPNDLVFHSTVHGAAFFVVKNPDKKEIPESTKTEAAQAAVSYSSAWKAGWGSADAYCIKPEQVSKKAPSGQYLTKGAFMIYGEREWFKGVPLRMAIGFKVDETVDVIGGPVEAVKKNSKYFLEIGVGNKKSSELAREIKTNILRKTNKEDGQKIKGADLGEIQRWIPAGKGMLSK